MLLPTFENCVDPYFGRFSIVKLSPDKAYRVNTFLTDAYNRYVRSKGKPTELNSWAKMRQQLTGEAALEQFLGTDFIDYQINAFGQYSSKGVDGGDFSVKVFDMDHFPIIYRNTSKPLIFVMRLDKNDFAICGVASSQILRSYSNPVMVPENEPNRDRKGCFFGFDELRQFNDLASLRASFRR